MSSGRLRGRWSLIWTGLEQSVHKVVKDVATRVFWDEAGGTLGGTNDWFRLAAFMVDGH